MLQQALKCKYHEIKFLLEQIYSFFHVILSTYVASTYSSRFAAQDLFYGLPLDPTTVILATISIGLFGYGLCGILRPACVWHVEAVYWSTLPTVKTLQGLHWQELKNSKPLRYFW